MKKYNALLCGIGIICSFSLFAGKENEEAARKLFENLSHVPWNRCVYQNEDRNDFISVNKDRFLEKFDLFKYKLNELNKNLNAFDPSSLLILEGKKEYLLPFLYLFRLEKEFRYYGTCFGQLKVESPHMDFINEACKGTSFKTFQDIKEAIAQQNNNQGPIIVGIEHEEDIDEIEPAMQGHTKDDIQDYAREMHNRLVALARAAKLYKPKHVIFVSRMLNHAHPLCSNNETKIKNFYASSSDWKEQTNPQSSHNCSHYFFISQLQAVGLNVIPCSMYSSQQEYKKEKNATDDFWDNNATEEERETRFNYDLENIDKLGAALFPQLILFRQGTGALSK